MVVLLTKKCLYSRAFPFRVADSSLAWLLLFFLGHIVPCTQVYMFTIMVVLHYSTAGVLTLTPKIF